MPLFLIWSDPVLTLPPSGQPAAGAVVSADGDWLALNREKIVAGAQKFIQRGQLDKAIKEFQRIVEEDPKDVRTLLKIGDLYSKKGERDNATQTYLKVAEFYSDQGFFSKPSRSTNRFSRSIRISFK